MVSGSRMRALLLSKYRHLEITEIPAPTLVPGEVLVRFAACGIRGSDATATMAFLGGASRRLSWATKLRVELPLSVTAGNARACAVRARSLERPEKSS